MEIQPIERAAVSDEVLGQLVAEILSGRLAPGEPLPAERELALRFGVNRHAIREALKGVRQAGLVRISQGDKTRVLDWRENAGLDVLTALATTGAVPSVELMRDVFEMRRSIAADAARLCAQRADDAQIAAVLDAAASYPERADDTSPEAIVAADVAFWIAVINGSGNIAYRLAMNTMLSGLETIGIPAMQKLGLLDEYADRDSHIRLARHIADHDVEATTRLATTLLSRVLDVIATTK
ncbi:FadR/GntR family transcriptional regulator [Gordonia sp. (in: high G+C Gram-positive bacteria)]|uniref:FadR/GntR family transcriptional regulator n=1 Tax=Gordonia sp. (in: high G+C Gram-positive bacteria) TaxID=84139 RepID=UPI00262ABF8B|nr:GntR family transcriptional regulator [Gordonia sp. (in: high G+C Gram-positive bacteria)]HMS74040.1 GntR family transcriptional regulator [Gordonia sp. (in: high G+C Gram-positive bacteria)]